ncbi:MAG: hypothetical protein H0X39_00180 [Actinobacteria bacterium]|nr:hypothetical protein [Actinomycetota bacterium]
MSEYGAHLLGRVAPDDSWHLQLHAFSAGPPPDHVEVQIKRPTLDQYDQGNTPHCVAYATSKVMNHFNQFAFDAEWLYARAKEVDGMPGVDGTNARAACDVLRSKGHWRRIKGKNTKTGPDKKHGIESNTWAQTVDEIRSVFAAPKPQPVLIGIDWLSAWFQPVEKHPGEYWLQDVDRAGSSAGGHEIGIWGCSDERQAFGLSNTWGNGWVRGDRLVWLPYKTMDWLFGHNADACVVKDLASR